MPSSRQHSTPKPEKRERQSHGGPQLNAPGGARIAQHVRMNRDDYQARRRLGMLLNSRSTGRPHKINSAGLRPASFRTFESRRKFHRACGAASRRFEFRSWPKISAVRSKHFRHLHQNTALGGEARRLTGRPAQVEGFVLDRGAGLASEDASKAHGETVRLKQRHRGLDPRVHAELPSARHCRMDCRFKPAMTKGRGIRMGDRILVLVRHGQSEWN